MEGLYIFLGIVAYISMIMVVLYTVKNREDNTSLVEALLLCILFTPIIALIVEMLKPYKPYLKDNALYTGIRIQEQYSTGEVNTRMWGVHVPYGSFEKRCEDLTMAYKLCGHVPEEIIIQELTADGIILNEKCIKLEYKRKDTEDNV